MNGSRILKEENTSPTVYNKVKVYAAHKFYPVAPNTLRDFGYGVTDSDITYPASAASLGPVKVSKINTAYNETTSTYDKSYVVTDFVNIKNPQSIPAGKTFSGAVKLGDVSFLGSESDIVTGNGNLRAPPLTNCFIDVNSADTQKVSRKVSFQEMVTSNLKIVNGMNTS